MVEAEASPGISVEQRLVSLGEVDDQFICGNNIPFVHYAGQMRKSSTLSIYELHWMALQSVDGQGSPYPAEEV